jgi:hypothetical protein
MLKLIKEFFLLRSVDDHFRRALRRVSSESNIAKEEQWTDYRFDGDYSSCHSKSFFIKKVFVTL